MVVSTGYDIRSSTRNYSDTVEAHEEQRLVWLYKELGCLKIKRKIYRQWKNGHATKEANQEIARKWRDKVSEVKVKNELHLAREIKDNKNVSINMLIRKD